MRGGSSDRGEGGSEGREAVRGGMRVEGSSEQREAVSRGKQ